MANLLQAPQSTEKSHDNYRAFCPLLAEQPPPPKGTTQGWSLPLELPSLAHGWIFLFGCWASGWILQEHGQQSAAELLFGVGMCRWDRAGALKLHNCTSRMMFLDIMKNFFQGDHTVRSWGAALHDNWMVWAFPIWGPQQCKYQWQPWICISGTALLIWSSLKWACSEVEVDTFCCEHPEMHLHQAAAGVGVFLPLHMFKDGKWWCKAILFLLVVVVPSPCNSDQGLFCQGLLFCCS